MQEMRQMVKIAVYFDYAESRSSSNALEGEALAEELADLKMRAGRFESELAHRIPDGDTLTVESKSIGDLVAAYKFSSSLSFNDFMNEIREAAKGLNLKPTHLRHW